MITVWVEAGGRSWFGVAHHGGRLVATAIGSDRDGAAAAVRSCLPKGREHRMVDEGSEYARGVVRLLARLEAGEEEAPFFELCPDCVGEPLASVLRVASTIPRGYVASYGGIAAASGTEARVVGHVMSTNPLYPIVPCHRVVGADLSLVGYTGSQDGVAWRRGPSPSAPRPCRCTPWSGYSRRPRATVSTPVCSSRSGRRRGQGSRGVHQPGSPARSSACSAVPSQGPGVSILRLVRAAARRTDSSMP
jgi:methylated-DNA-[protein]-cysteine S-methyltransferase